MEEEDSNLKYSFGGREFEYIAVQQRKGFQNKVHSPLEEEDSVYWSLREEEDYSLLSPLEEEDSSLKESNGGIGF